MREPSRRCSDGVAGGGLHGRVVVRPIDMSILPHTSSAQRRRDGIRLVPAARAGSNSGPTTIFRPAVNTQVCLHRFRRDNYSVTVGLVPGYSGRVLMNPEA